jgi:reactive intermediate/imine deaminase
MHFIPFADATGRSLPFSAAVRVGDMLYLSGVIGHLPDTLTLAPGGIRAQAKQAMDNLGGVLASCGLGFADIVKCTIMLGDMADWRAFNEIYVGYFEPGRLPARSAFGANGLALGALVEIEAMARFP